MSWETEFVALLRRQLLQRQARDPKYSIRKFAKSLDLSPSALGDLLRGKQDWKMTRERAVEMVNRMELPAPKTSRILELLGQGPRRTWKPVSAEPENDPLLTNWIYPAVLSSFDLKDPRQREPAALARRLGVPRKKITEALAELTLRGFLRPSATGTLERNPGHLASGDGPPSRVIREYHKTNLQVAARALDEIPAPLRDFSTATFIGNRRQLEEVRAEIRSLHERIVNLMENDGESAEQDEIFRLSVCLFPMNFQQPEI